MFQISLASRFYDTVGTWTTLFQIKDKRDGEIETVLTKFLKYFMKIRWPWGVAGESVFDIYLML